MRSPLLALDFAAIVTTFHSFRGSAVEEAKTTLKLSVALREPTVAALEVTYRRRMELGPESAPGGFGTVVPVAGTTVVEGIRRRVGRAQPPREPGAGPDLGRSATTGLGDR